MRRRFRHRPPQWRGAADLAVVCPLSGGPDCETVPTCQRSQRHLIPKTSLSWSKPHAFRDQHWHRPLLGQLAEALSTACTGWLRRQLERWQRQRQFVVLLAEDAATGQLLGAVTVSLTRCEAALPPPLPTSKPLR